MDDEVAIHNRMVKALQVQAIEKCLTLVQSCHDLDDAIRALQTFHKNIEGENND